MDSDDEIMFHQMIAGDAALDDNGENHMVLATLLDAQAELGATSKRGGSQTCRLVIKNHQRTIGHMLLFNYYFSQNPANTALEFRRHFKMKREVFIELVHGVREYDDYFELKKD